MQEPIDDMITAIHEAGHAICTWALGGWVTSVSIEPNEDSDGRCFNGGGSDRAAIHAAGNVACRLLGQTNQSFAFDRRASGDRELIKRRPGETDEDFSSRQRQAEDAAWETLRPYKRYIVRLAKALLERRTLSGDEAARIVQEV